MKEITFRLFLLIDLFIKVGKLQKLSESYGKDFSLYEISESGDKCFDEK